tara:strand:- start:517 stop:756 length:240 start_codon:yes stop_codon:yes gene_type:complete
MAEKRIFLTSLLGIILLNIIVSSGIYFTMNNKISELERKLTQVDIQLSGELKAIGNNQLETKLTLLETKVDNLIDGATQ